MLQIENIKTGVKSDVTPEQWKELNENPLYKNKFKKIQDIKIPKEVKDLEQKTQAKAKEKNADK